MFRGAFKNHFQSKRRYKKVASDNWNIDPIDIMMDSVRGDESSALAQVTARTITPFLHNNVAPAARRVGVDL